MTGTDQADAGGGPVRRGRRATLRDIANALEVSPSLVSKVLNRRHRGRAGASLARTEAIFAKAAELDYRRNANAVSMVQGRLDTIAVFAHEHGARGSDITYATVKAAARRAAELHQRLLLQFYDHPDEFAAMAAAAHPSNMDGLLLIGISSHQTPDALRQLLERRIPVVTVYDRPLHPSFPNIGMDQGEVARLATAHLVERGCRRIGLLATQSPAGRVEGYRRALRDAGLEFDEALAPRVSGFTAGAAAAAVAAWRERGIAFDGVVGQSDQHAAGAINVLLAAGVRVPEEVRVIGMDDSPFCDFYAIPISSVSPEPSRRGELGMTALHRHIGGEPVESVTVAPRLRARASSGGAAP